MKQEQQKEVIECGAHLQFLNSMRLTMLNNTHRVFWRELTARDMTVCFTKAYTDLALALTKRQKDLSVTEIYHHAVNLANWAFIIADVFEQHLTLK